jgi:hypothetical protein
MADDAATKPLTEVKQALTFDTPDGAAPGGIDVAAILKKRAQRALVEDRQRAQARRGERRSRDKSQDRG